MKLKRITAMLALVTAAFVWIGPAQASKGFTLECTIAAQASDGGFAEMVYIGFTEGWRNPSALDWAIQEVYQAPIPVQLLSNEGRRARVQWDIKGLKYADGTSIGRSIYNASVDKQTLHLQMSLRIPGGNGRYAAHGQCKKIS